MIKNNFSPCINVSVRECIRLIIEAGLHWELITEPEISEKIDEETQTRSITIVLNNSPYLQGTFFKVDDTIVLNVLKTFVEDLGGCTWTQIKTGEGWEVAIHVDIDNDSIHRVQIRQYIADAKKANKDAIWNNYLNRREVEMANEPNADANKFYYTYIAQ
jgi:hypothetical protein